MKLIPNIMSKTAALALMITIASGPVAAVDSYKTIDDYVANNKETIRLNSGTAVAVIKGNEIVYEGYFGYADIEQRIAVDHNSAFYIASMTKPFTALLALLQEHANELDTNQTLAAMFPELNFKRSLRADQVTVRDLLSHTSGIDNWPLVQATAYTGLHDKSVIDQLLEESYVNDQAPLGEYEYTNVGYNVLSHWMDNNLGADWQSLLADRIFQPLGMNITSARISDAQKNQWTLAKGYSVKSPEPTVPVYLTKNDASMHAAGGMISTARDLARFLIMQVNYGKLDGKQIFPTSVIKKSHQKLARYQRFGSERYYGWGWFVRNEYDQTLLEHRGGYSGASTYMSFMPEQKIGLVVLSNQDRWGGDLAYALESLAYGIALGKEGAELAAIVEKYQTHATEKAKKHYAVKATTASAVATDLNSEYLGTYVHPTLGKIQVEELSNGSFQLQWGNLRSLLYIGEETHQLEVEFIPNSQRSILFLSGSDKQQRIQFRDYEFKKVSE